MKRVVAVVFAILQATVWGCSQTATPAPAGAGPTKVVRHYGSFPAKVIKTLDSSKLKEGDPVEVATAGSFKLPDGALVPKGSKLIGHVTVAKAVSKGDAQSELVIAFDKLNIANGKQLAIMGIVQAVFPPSGELDPRFTNGPMAKESGIGLSGDVKNGSNMDSHLKAQPAENPESVGVQGIKDLELGKSGELSSKGKNVKLGVDVRLVIKAAFIE
jgi:hypothetical protein